MVLMILGLVTMFTDNPFLHNLYCAVGIICFGLYLIVDTQMIMGGREVSFGVDDHIVAALYLYIDIIQIFLYILELLRNMNSSDWLIDLFGLLYYTINLKIFIKPYVYISLNNKLFK